MLACAGIHKDSTGSYKEVFKKQLVVVACFLYVYVWEAVLLDVLAPFRPLIGELVSVEHSVLSVVGSDCWRPLLDPLQVII